MPCRSDSSYDNPAANLEPHETSVTEAGCERVQQSFMRHGLFAFGEAARFQVSFHSQMFHIHVPAFALSLQQA